jgi:phosphatidylglycerol:prolipoprotein diacylglycerol transferase
MLHLSPHPELHALFETLAYALGFTLYRRTRTHTGDVITLPQRWSIIAAATLGALAGSRLLGLLEQAPRMHIGWAQVLTPTGGKTIVGGLLGGWLAVELTKKVQHIETRTGDLFAIPLCLGILIGRIGCLLAGLADDTYGTPTSLPWAVDFGDGIPRHPTQAYEIFFLALLALVLHLRARRPHRTGALFRIFLASYLTWRFVVDFIKPQPLVAGLNFIQWSCVGGLVILAIQAFQSRSLASGDSPHEQLSTSAPTSASTPHTAA